MDKIFNDTACLWEELAESCRPTVMYGTGNGGDKIISALSKYGVRLDAVFASNDFVRSREFHGLPVETYDAVRARFGEDMNVLLAFGTTLPEVSRFIRELDARHRLFIPEVPLYGGELFDREYFEGHKEEILSAKELLSDGYSQALYEDMLCFRLGGRLSELSRTEEYEMSLSSLPSQDTEVAVDCGAFRGDSTEMMLRSLKGIKKLYAVEPDARTFKRLCESFADDERVLPLNFAVSDADTTREFSSSGSRGAGVDGKNRRARSISVECRRLDTLLCGERVDLIKYDVEGDEAAAIEGSRGIIGAYKPDLAVSVYHKTADLWELTRSVHELLPEHRLYLRRVPCIPAWDLTLFAVKGH